MGFGEFFLYMTISNVIYTVSFYAFLRLRFAYKQYRFRQLIREGKIKVVTMEDIVEQMQGQGDKKTWN